MEIQRIEGVVVRCHPFQNNDKILTVFTSSEGMLKFVVKGAYKGNKGVRTDPLSLVELVFTRGKGELYSCRELALLQGFLPLRQNLPALEGAGDMLQALLTSQGGQKPAPLLYALLLNYLANISQASHPESVSASFRLKTLKHEGLLNFSPFCMQCTSELENMILYQGECYCLQHGPVNGSRFTKTEKQMLEHLTACQYFSEIKNYPIPEDFPRKVKRLFQEHF